MEDNNFSMPLLNFKSSKTLQLGALQVVCTVEALAYNSLVDEEKRLRRIFPQYNRLRGSIFLNKANTNKQDLYHPKPGAATPAATPSWII